MGAWLAQFLGTLMGNAVKSMGREGVEALMRGFADALVEKQVISKPNSDLESEWMRNERDSAKK